MKKRCLHTQLKGSTLVEVLVALVIITLVMALAATLYAKIAYKRPDNTVALQLRLKALAQEAKREGDFETAHYETDDNLLIDRHTEPYRGDTLLLLLELTGQKKGTGETGIYREIIIKDIP
ncbi:type II secretion system protein [Parapedobacter tibetensis]|uniref:type II secretion system protein n=1 Tax=Parapedobacter tibetensis TaxID=2972951 RepID=UPI00214D5669|nr:prepilin-type N-terminal cleavage/methylation domain-containing protein [Parapedobacter tibetensis]